MSEEKNLESVDAGSSKDVDPGVANMADLGESTTNKNEDNMSSNEEKVSAEQLKNLEAKLGTQGKELGEHRAFVKEISPLMEKLQGNPELINAILKDKISLELIDSVKKGEVSIEDAKDITEAHKEVKKDLGKEYTHSSPDNIEKLVEDKIGELRTDFQKTLNEKDQQNDYEDKIKDFIKETTDFPEYANSITKYIEEHPGLMDIKVAYDAVKGQALQAKYKKEEDKEAAEVAKNVAANAGGGTGQNSSNMSKEDLLNDLIGAVKDPNSFI